MEHHRRWGGTFKNCISYILNSDKTEGLVGGNAGTTPQEVYQVMMDTKQEWEKENGRQGYHFVISFPPGEATKEEAYAVINDFVRNIWEKILIMCFPFTLTKNICMDILFLILSTEWMGISTVMKKETGKIYPANYRPCL